MHPLLPIGLLLLAAGFGERKTTPASPPARRPAPAAAPPPKPGAGAKHAAPHTNAVPGSSPVSITHESVPATAAEQAAVDAAVSHAIRRDLPPTPEAAAPTGPAPNPPPAPAQAEAEARTPKEAAAALLKFLVDTGRFGSKTDHVPEVADAQRDLGVTADGIVGPSTREAAKQQGVALPPRPPARKRK